MLKIPISSPKIWHTFFNENKSIVFRYVIKKLRPIIENNEVLTKDMELFKFENGSVYKVSYADFDAILQAAITAFVETEEYEHANKAKKLLDFHKINVLLKEVSNGV
jgi:hypothetical protein